MATSTHLVSRFWRWVLIVAEFVLVGELIAIRVTPLARQYTGASAATAVASGIAWVFLFLGSPFLVRSQRWLAIVGWGLAAVALLSGSLWYR
jgi:hypothetical protein